MSGKEVCFAYCSTEEMVADCFTQRLLVSKTMFCLSGMGVAYLIQSFAVLCNSFRVDKLALYDA